MEDRTKVTGGIAVRPDAVWSTGDIVDIPLVLVIIERNHDDARHYQ